MTNTPINLRNLEPDLDQAVNRAKTFATLAHHGQKDNITGGPYIEHPHRVVGYLPDVLEGLGPELPFEPDVVALATLETVTWLHNVLEWTWATEDILRQMFDSIVVGAVVRLTRGYFATDNQVYEERKNLPAGSEYYRLVNADPWARVVEVADMLDHTEPVRMMSLSPADRLASTKEGWISATALGVEEFVGQYNATRWAAYGQQYPGRHAAQDAPPNKESH